ncbi:MAG TPA: sporulation protein YunB [Firmicutes bacterium]|nr:sporulation protein YunB [Bacillota bacterium]
MAAVVAAFVLVYGGKSVEKAARENLKAFAEIHICRTVTEIVTQAVNESLAGIDCSRIVKLHRNSKDEVEIVEVDALLVNLIQARCVAAMQRALAQLGKYKVEIPAGQFLGSVLFANLGPELPITIQPLGFVGATVRDKFESAGINQSRLSFYADISMTVRVVVPLLSYDLNVNTSLPLSAVVIPGKVPGGLLSVL